MNYTKQQVRDALAVMIRLGFSKDDYARAIVFINKWAHDNYSSESKSYCLFKPAYALVKEILKFKRDEPICVIKLRVMVEKYGVTVNFGENWIELTAPMGYLWFSSGNITFCIQHYSASIKEIEQDIKSEMDEIKRGLYKCVDKKELAAIQYDLDDNDWFPPEDGPKMIEIE